jgi:hypothetical protein
MASPSSIITLGYGTGSFDGSPSEVLTLGYGIAEIIPPRTTYIPSTASGPNAYRPVVSARRQSQSLVLTVTRYLQAYYACDESSGNLIDSHGDNDLTENSGTIDAAVGLVNGARDLEASDTEDFFISDNSVFSIGVGVSCGFYGWVNLEGTNGSILSKREGNNPFEYDLRVTPVSTIPRFQWIASPSGTSTGAVIATADDVEATTGEWYFIAAWFDAVLGVQYIQINNGEIHTMSLAQIADSNADFIIGARGDPTNFLDGLIDEWAFVKGGFLDADEREWVYNEGAGRSYSEWVTVSTPGYVPRAARRPNATYWPTNPTTPAG